MTGNIFEELVETIDETFDSFDNKNGTENK